MTVKNVFICGPYRAKDLAGVKANIYIAKQAAIKVARAGHYPVCPHLNTGLFDFELILQDIPDQVYLDGCLKMLTCCNYLYVVTPDNITSGMKGEIQMAKTLDIPVIAKVTEIR